MKKMLFCLNWYSFEMGKIIEVHRTDSRLVDKTCVEIRGKRIIRSMGFGGCGIHHRWRFEDRPRDLNDSKSYTKSTLPLPVVDLYPDAEKWLLEEINGTVYTTMEENLYFEDEDDAVLFKLTWC